MVASAAAIVFESPVCDERVLAPATIVLFHNATIRAEGKAGQIKDDSDMLHALNFAIAALIAPRMGLTPDAYLAWVDGHDRWLNAESCVELRYADRLGEP
jgi:ATP-dependent protease ClpP protease subunit